MPRRNHSSSTTRPRMSVLIFATRASKEQSPPTLARRGNGSAWPGAEQNGLPVVHILTNCAPNVMFSGSAASNAPPSLRKRRTSLRCTPVSRLMRLSVGTVPSRRNSR
ncbi:hypothetical protein D3C77_626260 [compost metagenome]